ncbi:MAG: MATE family efflux transporter [Armatimonadetes bacterium]|nr:MATE family efflux transporter [Armatimonadota bacterium]
MLSQFRAESRLTLALAIPIMAGQVSQMLMGIVDSAMVGHAGVLPLAASAFANNLVSVPFVFGMGLLTSLSVRAAQSHGAGEARESGEILRHGLFLAAIVGAILTLLVWILSFHLHRFGQSPDVAAASRSFLLLIGFSLVPALLSLGLKAWCEAIGSPWPPTLILLASVPLNIALNWVLIYGNLGFSPLGLDGAGWATLISRLAALITMVIYVARDAAIRPHLPVMGIRKWQMARFASLLAIGIPASLQILLEVGAFAAGAILVGRLGKEPLAAHQIALSCASTTFMLPLGLAMATTVRIGQALGSGEFARVRPIGLASMGLSFGVMSATALIFWIFGLPIARSFVADEGVALLASRLLAIAALFQLVDGLQVVGAGALRGLSDATVPMLVCFVAYWLVGLPAGYYAAFMLGWGAQGIWGGFALGLSFVAALLAWRFWVKSWFEPLSDRV